MAGGLKGFIEELLEPLSGTTIRSMFGGHGVFRDGVMFGILDDDVLYLRVDETTQKKYEAEESKQFTYPARGRLMALPYWQVPERLFDDADEFVEWATAGYAAAMQAKAARQPKGRKVRTGTAKQSKAPAARTNSKMKGRAKPKSAKPKLKKKAASKRR
jgi:DNA transformation protein